MRLARDVRADVVINRIGQFPDDEKDPRSRCLIEALTALGTFGDHVGVRFAAQTGAESPQQSARLIDALPEHTVGFDLHPSGLILAGHSPGEVVEVLGPHVLHVHACDAVRELGQRGREVDLGRGVADFPDLLGRLTEFDYRGWVTIERRESSRPVADIENAVAYLRSL
jgi:sugar phosphate isomerase/epimerase